MLCPAGGLDGQLRQTLTELTGHLPNCPVYMIVSDDATGVGAFSVPPQPGILAFLLQLHHVDVENTVGDRVWWVTGCGGWVWWVTGCGG